MTIHRPYASFPAPGWYPDLDTHRIGVVSTLGFLFLQPLAGVWLGVMVFNMFDPSLGVSASPVSVAIVFGLTFLGWFLAYRTGTSVPRICPESALLLAASGSYVVVALQSLYGSLGLGRSGNMALWLFLPLPLCALVSTIRVYFRACRDSGEPRFWDGGSWYVEHPPAAPSAPARGRSWGAVLLPACALILLIVSA